MPQAMEIDGSGEVDHSKPAAPSRNDYGSTNIETLSNQLQKINVSHMAKEQKKKKAPKYIDTSKLLNFKRESKRSKASSDA
ncbi:unnamed protein product [Phytophthora lilii]|uniref:Unnamed protein product n=1 Tax=Phytophthora lilii TaxID=2077276 RepID=A0A9W6XB24_9STRA|nr:unnamed protein product [Phytophthora lilii]